MIIYRKPGALTRVVTEFTTTNGIEFGAFVGQRGGKFQKYKTLEALDKAMDKIGFKRATAGRASPGEKQSGGLQDGNKD